MPNYIGLHIKKNRVDAVALKIAGDSFTLLEYVSSDYSGEESLADAISEVARRFDHFSASWVVGLPAEDFSFRHLTFPFKKRKAVIQALKFELETVLPYSSQDMEFSQAIISSGEKTKLLASAVMKKDIEQYRTALRKAGILARVMMPDVIALGDFGTSLLGVKENAFIADVDRNGALMCFLGEKGYMDIQSSERDVMEFRRFLATTGVEPERKFIGGEGADSSFTSFSSNGDEWKRELREKLKSTISPERMMVPLGLAARGALSPREGINFSKDSGFYKKYLSGFGIHAVGAALFLMLWIMFMIHSNGVKSSELAATKAQIDKVFKTALPGVKGVKPAFQLKEKVDELETRLKATGLVESERSDLLWLLVKLSEKVPSTPTYKVREVSLDERGVMLAGEADTIEEINKLREALEGIGSYKTVEVNETKPSPDKKNTAFKIRMKK